MYITRQLGEFILPSTRVPEIKTQVLNLYSKCFCLLSHPANPAWYLNSLVLLLMIVVFEAGSRYIALADLVQAGIEVTDPPASAFLLILKVATMPGSIFLR